MPHTVHVAGPCEIYIDTGAANALEALGFSRNGVDLRDEAFWMDVPGDENGGDQGPPIEVLKLMGKGTCRMELTKWDRAIERKIAARTKGGVEGSVGTVATKMFAENKTFKIVLQSTGRPVTLFRCILRGPIEEVRGARYSSLILEWEYHHVDGLLYGPYGTSSESGTD